MKICLSGIACQLGEEEAPYTDVPHFEELVQQYKIPNLASYWGWGHYRSTGNSIYDLLKPALEASLQALTVSREAIDLVIFCSAGSNEYYHVVNEKLGKLLQSVGLYHPLIMGQSFTGCVSIFSAIRLGMELLKSGSFRNILVVTTDRVPGDVDRFRKFAIYSDAASAFHLSAGDDGDYEVMGVATSASTPLMSGTVVEQDIHFQHLNETHKKLMQGDAVRSVDKIFMTNLYKPLVQLNVARLGYQRQQSFLNNISRVGHCFSSDPLVNLLDYKASVTDAAPGTYMLAAMATGHAGFCLIQDNEQII